jgi:hypothetical protein
MLSPLVLTFLVFGIPVWLYCTLKQASASGKLYTTKPTNKEQPTVQTSLGWVYLKYNDRHPCFELWYLLSKLIVAILPACLSSAPEAWLAGCMLAVQLAGLVLLVRQHPFASLEEQLQRKNPKLSEMLMDSRSQSKGAEDGKAKNPLAELAVIMHLCTLLCMVVGFIFLSLPSYETDITVAETQSKFGSSYGSYSASRAAPSLPSGHKGNIERTILVAIFLLLFFGSLVYSTLVAVHLTIQGATNKQSQLVELQSLIIKRATIFMKEPIVQQQARGDSDSWAKFIKLCDDVTALAEGGKAVHNVTDAVLLLFMPPAKANSAANPNSITNPVSEEPEETAVPERRTSVTRESSQQQGRSMSFTTSASTSAPRAISDRLLAQI